MLNNQSIQTLEFTHIALPFSIIIIVEPFLKNPLPLNKVAEIVKYINHTIHPQIFHD